MQQTALVCGAGGFIGAHLVNRLKKDGFWVRGVDLKLPEFFETQADDFIVGDLRDPLICRSAIDRRFDEIYQLAADMGGAGYVFVGDNDAAVMHNSAMINLNVLQASRLRDCSCLFFSSSACVYPEYNQREPYRNTCAEDTVYPAQPDSEYGWEKLFSERLYQAYHRNYGLKVAIGRYHNVFGPAGTWTGGKEKAPAAICRKVAEAQDGDAIEVWGSGEQTRSFLYIDECIEGTVRLLRSGLPGPYNIGSEEMFSINELAREVIRISGKTISIKNVSGPVGVWGRNSDNRKILKDLGWAPRMPMREGLRKTYEWVESRVIEAVS